MEHICRACAKVIVKGRMQPSFYESSAYHWHCIAYEFLHPSEVLRDELGKLIIVAEFQDRQWICLLCNKRIQRQAWEHDESIVNHLYKEHHVSHAQVGYTWVGYQEGLW